MIRFLAQRKCYPGLLLAFSVLFFSGCASIFSGTQQVVRIKSQPEGARVFVDGKDSGLNTPARFRVRRMVQASRHNGTNEHVYTLKKEGYEDLEIHDRRRINGLALALDFPLLFPMIIDFANGSIYKYKRKHRVNMVEAPPAPADSVPVPPNVIVAERPVAKQTTVEKMEPSVDENIPETGQVNPNAIAVVIGNAQYRNKDIPAVDFAINDAQSIRKYLLKAFGYQEQNILFLQNAGLADFNRTFGNRDNFKARLFNMVKPFESDVFVYYSGHGAPDPETGQGYLVPADCGDVSLIRFDGYPLEQLYQNLSKIPFRSLTLVLDACFSGNSEGGMLIKNASPVYIRSENLLMSNEKAVVFTSSEGNQISSWYNAQRHSLFTYFFLRGLQGAANRDGDKQRLTVLEMREYLLEHLPYMARRLHNRSQTPEVWGKGDQVVLRY